MPASSSPSARGESRPNGVPLKIRAAVIGATGYTGAETLRYLLGHPYVEISAAVARSGAGMPVSDVLRGLVGRTDLLLEPYDPDALGERADVALCCLPHGDSQEIVDELRTAGLTVFDLSADHRLGGLELHEKVYGEHRFPERLDEAVYGSPELFREQLRDAELVAVPGCYPTSANLALWPLLAEGLIEPDDIIVDAKSGVSGAGRTPALASHFAEAGEGLTAYKVLVHRHGPEIEHALGSAVGAQIRVLFTPHLVPMTRGILCTAYARLRPGVAATSVREAYAMAYDSLPFVHLLPEGRAPRTQDVRGTNNAHVQGFVREDDGRVIAISAIDNLGKGAAGQAVQCMNLAMDLGETSGLDMPALVP